MLTSSTSHTKKARVQLQGRHTRTELVLTRHPAFDVLIPPPPFSIRADSGRNRPIQSNSGGNESWNGRIDKILAETTSEMGRYGWLWPKWAASHHSFASCGLVSGKKKKKEKEEEDERRHKNMVGRRIKVYNKRL